MDQHWQSYAWAGVLQHEMRLATAFARTHARPWSHPRPAKWRNMARCVVSAETAAPKRPIKPRPDQPDGHGRGHGSTGAPACRSWPGTKSDPKMGRCNLPTHTQESQKVGALHEVSCLASTATSERTTAHALQIRALLHCGPSPWLLSLVRNPCLEKGVRGEGRFVCCILLYTQGSILLYCRRR